MAKMIKNSVNITVEPGSQTLSYTSGEPLINLLAENGIFLRADCGGKGVCNKCVVEVQSSNGDKSRSTQACTCIPTEDSIVTIPASSLMSSHILKKAGVNLPDSYTHATDQCKTSQNLGIAVDLGTTTIAIYLCDKENRTVLSSLPVKNPQSLCGADVMSRISYIGQDDNRLKQLQHMVTSAIDWGVLKLLKKSKVDPILLKEMVVVGNPTMIHILAGISPESIGVAPYAPTFYEAKKLCSTDIFKNMPEIEVFTLPQLSGFIGGDILAATIGSELESCPSGTLLIDLGTNGELMLKDNGTFYATSCATGPAFEGAALSCGIQAIPGAIDKVSISSDGLPSFTLINGNDKAVENPVGICGSGVISAAASFLNSGVIDSTGLFAANDNFAAIKRNDNITKFELFNDNNGNEIAINQKDIRSLQLGKAALRTGIECLLKKAGRTTPEAIIVAGAFGSHVDKHDLLTLGMIPDIDPEKIHIAGNSAGAGAIMALCDKTFDTYVKSLSDKTDVLHLTDDSALQNIFISYLNF